MGAQYICRHAGGRLCNRQNMCGSKEYWATQVEEGGHRAGTAGVSWVPVNDGENAWVQTDGKNAYLSLSSCLIGKDPNYPAPYPEPFPFLYPEPAWGTQQIPNDFKYDVCCIGGILPLLP